jgi:hypothetical protein
MLPNLEAFGDLTQAEVDTLWDYQRRAGARSLKFRAWPLNVGFNTNTDACVTNDLPWRLTAAAPLNGTGIDAAEQLSGSGLWRCVAAPRPPVPTPALVLCPAAPRPRTLGPSLS